MMREILNLPRVQVLEYVMHGDAYGAPFEYASEEVIQARNNLSGYFAHHKYKMGNGRYTDDTQMAIAVAEVLMYGDWSKRAFAEAFVRGFKRDQRGGYAGHFYAFLLTVQDADDFLQRIKPYSDKSGGAMRAGPVGLLRTEAEVLEIAALQASLTHDTPLGRGAAQAAALMVHYLYYGLGPKKDLPRFLTDRVPVYDWTPEYRGEVGSKGWQSVHAALTDLMRAQSVEDVLTASIARGGDVDTSAAIAMAAASADMSLKRFIPPVLQTGLENGPFGRDFVLGLDSQLDAWVRAA